jgi:cysteinyl-tRNA synthetase
MKNYINKATLVVLILFAFSCSNSDDRQSTPIAPITSTQLNGIEISNFMYQIQELDDPDAIDILAASDYDMLVIEPGFNFTGSPYNTNLLVSKLKDKPNGEKRILLAYIDIGEAEDYRTYWQNTWVAPTANQSGDPSFLVTIDPDGWSGNYPVAYWETEWQNIWLENTGIIEQIATYGFDGVYLDWVEGYDDDKIIARAQSDNVNPENEMMNFIQDIKSVGESINPNFLIVAQNAPYLLDADPSKYAGIIDALSTEDTWFYGEGDLGWDDPDAGDLSGDERHSGAYSTANRIIQNKKYLALGIPVFTVDYCISESNANFVYNESRSNGFIPLVTRVSLSQITETPSF